MPVSETSGEPEPPSPPPGRFPPEPTSGELDPVPSPAALPPLVEPVPLLEPSKLIATRGAGFIRIAAVAVRSNAPGSSLGSLSVMAGNGANCSSSDCGVSSDDMRTGRPGVIARQTIGVGRGARNRRRRRFATLRPAARRSTRPAWRATTPVPHRRPRGWASRASHRPTRSDRARDRRAAAHPRRGPVAWARPRDRSFPVPIPFLSVGPPRRRGKPPKAGRSRRGLAMPRRRRPSRPDHRRSRPNLLGRLGDRRGDVDRCRVAGQDQMGQQRKAHALAQRTVLPPARVHQHGQSGGEKEQPKPEYRHHRFHAGKRVDYAMELRDVHGFTM